MAGSLGQEKVLVGHAIGCRDHLAARWRSRPPRDQASAKTAVTVTVIRWRPGETGTGEGVADDRAAPEAIIGNGSAEPCSDMLTTGPTDLPSALAYWAALVLASATALARAAASSELASLTLRETPATSVALPPARTASLIWVPAVASLRRVTAIDSLAPYPVGSAELPAYCGWIDMPEVWMSERRTPDLASAAVTARTAWLARCSAALTEASLV